MLHGLRDRRRAEARKRLFPTEGEVFVRSNVAHHYMLDDAERSELQAMLQVFLEEKNWEGCGGLDLTGEIRQGVRSGTAAWILSELGVTRGKRTAVSDDTSG